MRGRRRKLNIRLVLSIAIGMALMKNFSGRRIALPIAF